MSIITAKGKQAKESANKKNQQIDFKKAFIKLKGGDSVRVRILSEEDYIEYLAHGSYAKGVYTQPCIEPAGERCALCEAAKFEGEKDDKGNPVWKQLGRRKKYLMAFADIDEGIVRFFDATKKQFTGLEATISEYAENLGEIAFTLKRTGNGKDDTTYTLNPILKLKPADQEKFSAFDGQTVEIEMFETVLQARTFEQQLKELQKAGFPVKEVFGVDVSASDDSDEDDVEEIEEGDEDPTKGF